MRASYLRLNGRSLLVKRTNYKQEKRIKELEKLKKKEAKKERRENKDKETPAPDTQEQE